MISVLETGTLIELSQASTTQEMIPVALDW